jgi:hypothetical protein
MVLFLRGSEQKGGEERDVPPTIPSPDRRMGTREMVEGEMVVVVYS